ncbi:aldehyde dehydrogenase family protein [Yoonia sediminilitoris]|uniref:Acyl-CoA reductase-like NAD-dependent aldehyde dehydrogenase n=1 Tax=Yoonia sediminilitoris TaxID=1286148 RepID=A0A2T6K688_9RHOB|nr:aldehyde dehydrogenase family protein [Yoonia sediminilitoris]PUB10158.1 acyl-CoA reductase-like NAD-dependent aldehyde dehydrogenase [Yoonia sediminilitoris]RCW89680.1 acyl-CoA reductase-like NAD-dependent aldehyde dehydrogenase [Yoonia sediminilitoris]
MQLLKVDSGGLPQGDAQSSARMAEAAVDRAASAFASWSAWPVQERAGVLREMAALLDQRRGELYDLAAQEVGASRSWVDFNVDLGRDILFQSASLAGALADKEINDEKTGKRSLIRRQAAGVVLGMVSWNAPITLGVRAVASPLICGNSVVMKGSDFCPRTHQHLVDILNSSGIPPGVLNCVVSNSDEAHDTMVQLIGHPCVRRINFTGSTRVGREVAIEAARHLKPVLLELSGKAPLIVLEDADLDAAAQAACFGAYFNQGQICMSTERVIVVRSVADAFVAKLAACTRALSTPSADAKPVDLGRMISPDAAQRVKSLIEDAQSKGAHLLAGGDVDADVMQPALLDGLASNMRLYHEEAFGPVAGIMRVHDAEEAISIANDCDFGLSAAIFTQDTALAQSLADRLEFGVVQINGPTVHDDPAMPFGGMKLSGYGRFGGESTIHEFTELRWIAIHEDPDHPDF